MTCTFVRGLQLKTHICVLWFATDWIKDRNSIQEQ